MNYSINIYNTKIINQLNDIESINSKNKFINELLELGFKQYEQYKQTEEINNEQYKQTEEINNEIIKKELMNLNNKYDNQYENIKLLINQIKLENEKNMLVLNKNNNKGCLGETLVYEFFHKNNYQIEDTSEIIHSGDLKLYLSEINENVLIEIKNYKNTVDQKQIDKFYYDLNYTGIKLGIFISLQSKIANIKYPIEWRITEEKEILIFISECTEEYLYMAIFTIITLYKNNKYNISINLNKTEDLINDIKFLALQKDSINKLKNDIISMHDSYSTTIFSLYNNLCNFDNNFNYIINKIYNKLNDKLQIKSNYSDILLQLESISSNNKEILNVIFSDLNNEFNLELDVKVKKIKIIKNNNIIGEIKMLKTTINLVLSSGIEIKNINIISWNKIKQLL